MASDPTNVVSPLGQVAAAAPTRVAGQMAPLSLDEGGALRVALAATPSIDIGDVTLLAGSAIVGKVGIDQTTPGTTNAVSVPAVATGGYSFVNIAAGQATTTVKSGAGTLHAIVFNGPATATSTMVMYDNTADSGTVIGRPLATAVVMPVTVIYDLAFGTGLTIITATANGADMTVIYK